MLFHFIEFVTILYRFATGVFPPRNLAAEITPVRVPLCSAQCVVVVKEAAATRGMSATRITSVRNDVPVNTLADTSRARGPPSFGAHGTDGAARQGYAAPTALVSAEFLSRVLLAILCSLTYYRNISVSSHLTDT